MYSHRLSGHFLHHCGFRNTSGSKPPPITTDTINKNADHWLALDPSYKQYEYQQGLNAVAISGIDPQQLARQFIDSGQIDPDEGWATGFDPTILTQAQSQIQQSLEQYIQQHLSNPTVSDIIGGQKIIIEDWPALPSALPNRIITSGVRYDKLPEALQQHISWGLGKDITGRAINPIRFPFARVNNQKITLSFQPATAADEQALQSLLPQGPITDISQLPSSIPAYLIEVIPQLKLNGQVIRQAPAMNLGQEINLITQVQPAGRAAYRREYSVIAGSYLAVNAYAQNISPQQLQRVQQQLTQTKNTLDSQNDTEIQALTRQQLLGDLFHAGGLGYFSQLIALSNLMGRPSGNHYNLIAGIGTIGYEPKVDIFFGIPRAIKTGGISFDIPYLISNANNAGDKEKIKQYNLQTGLLSSALEHATPEQMFACSDPSAPKPDAISAVKALQKASAAGQRIYQITQANMSATLPNIHHDEKTMAEIRASLNAGKMVITHTDAINVPGWSGAGYIILDPETGVGAYKISGGGNGGFMKYLHQVENIFWAVISASTKGILKIASGLKTIYDEIKTFIDLITTCLTSKAVLGIISITFVMVGFALLAPLFVELTAVYTLIGGGLTVAYSLLAGFTVNSVSSGWLKSCE